MKDWPFFLAILALLILLLPMYEGYESDIINGLYFIKCGSYYCSLQGNMIVCNKTVPDDKDLFLIEKVNQNWLTSGGYSIRPNPTLNPDPIYNCADDGYAVICNRNYVNIWETFKITNIGDGYYTIKGGNSSNWDNQLCSGGIGQFLCKQKKQGESEKFQLIPQKKYNINKMEDMYTNVDKIKGQITELGKTTSNLEPIVTGIETMHRDLLGRSITAAVNINNINNSQIDVKNEIDKMNKELQKIDEKDKQMYTTRYMIQDETNTLIEKQLPRVQTELDELNKQYDLLLSARNFHKDKDIPANMDANNTSASVATFAYNPEYNTDANVATGLYTVQLEDKYCSDLENGVRCINDVVSVGTSDIWEIINLGDGNYNFKGGRANKFCRMLASGQLLCDTDSGGRALTFKLVKSKKEGYIDIILPDLGRIIIKITPYVQKIDPANVYNFISRR
jgi:hypothetical protein